MNNKVVTTMARAFKEMGIPSLRFNFRGVGHSEGSYDAGIGESERYAGTDASLATRKGQRPFFIRWFFFWILCSL